MSVTAPGREVSCFIASLGSLRLLALGPAVFSCTTLPSRGPTLFPLLSLLPPTHPQPRTCPGRGETNAGLGFCRGPRTPGSLKHKPWGSHGSELPLQEVCLPTCHPCLPSCLHPPGHLATQSANVGSVMLVGAVGSSKKYNTWSYSPRAHKSVDATGDMQKQPQYRTKGSKRWVWRVGDVKNAQRKKRPNKDWGEGSVTQRKAVRESFSEEEAFW